MLKNKSLFIFPSPHTFTLSIIKTTDMKSQMSDNRKSECENTGSQHLSSPIFFAPSHSSLCLNSMSLFLFSSCHFLCSGRSSHLPPWAPSCACSYSSGVPVCLMSVASANAPPAPLSIAKLLTELLFLLLCLLNLFFSVVFLSAFPVQVWADAATGGGAWIWFAGWVHRGRLEEEEDVLYCSQIQF